MSLVKLQAALLSVNWSNNVDAFLGDASACQRVSECNMRLAIWAKQFKRHTLTFSTTQQKLGVVSRIDSWYSEISAIVHGQIPGAWIDHKAVAEIAPITSTQDVVIAFFRKGEDIVHRLFLCTVGAQLWHGFSSQAKAKLLSGLTGDEKKVLALDSA
jgi:hypothetical protein